MEDRVDIEHEDFHYYGNPIEQEEETWGNQYRKKVKDAASTRALPVWKQVRIVHWITLITFNSPHTKQLPTHAGGD